MLLPFWSTNSSKKNESGTYCVGTVVVCFLLGSWPIMVYGKTCPPKLNARVKLGKETMRGSCCWAAAFVDADNLLNAMCFGLVLRDAKKLLSTTTGCRVVFAGFCCPNEATLANKHNISKHRYAKSLVIFYYFSSTGRCGGTTLSLSCKLYAKSNYFSVTQGSHVLERGLTYKGRPVTCASESITYNG